MTTDINNSTNKFLIILTHPDYKRPSFKLKYVDNPKIFIKNMKLDLPDKSMNYNDWCDYHYSDSYMNNDPLTIIEIIDNKFVEWEIEKIEKLWNSIFKKKN